MYTIFETNYWSVSYRRDSRYPDFLIIGAKGEGKEISSLTKEALAEMGSVLAKTERLFLSYFKPYRVVTAKLGFSSGFSCHFHMLQVSSEFLKEIEAHPSYTNEPDGNDALLFASREYGERALNNKEQREQFETIRKLKEHELANSKAAPLLEELAIIGVQVALS